MTFDELYKSVKKKFNEHPEIFLEREKLAIQITDVFNNSFFILWEGSKCNVEPYPYNDHDVCIIASQYDIEQLFTKRQYLFIAQQSMNIIGNFADVMAFQKLLSYMTKDNSYIVQEEIISNMLFKQDALRDDLGIIMQSLQLLLTNSLIELPEINAKMYSEEKEGKNSKTKKPASKKTVSKTKKTSSKKSEKEAF